MVIFENTIKIIVGIIGMIISGLFMYYFIKVEGNKQQMQEALENRSIDHADVDNQVSDYFTGNKNGEKHVYDTMDLTGGDSDETCLLGEEASEDTSLL